MGVHWYAVSRELADVERRLADVERRIFRPGAEAPEREAALDEREALFARADEARARLERSGAGVTVAATLGWPADVRRHVEALGVADSGRPLLSVLGWGTDYYIDNLRQAGVPMRGFSQPLDRLRVDAAQARKLGKELLRFASDDGPAPAVRHAREAGLWLFLWGSVDCTVEAAQ